MLTGAKTGHTKIDETDSSQSSLDELGINASQLKGWRTVKSETRRETEILVRNLSSRLFGEKFRDSKKVKTNHETTRLRDLSKTLPRF